MDWQWDGRYPVRARIVDVAGLPLPIPIPGVVCATPAVSKPHIGREGTAHLLGFGSVRIDLDDGGTIRGSECWWEPVGPVVGAA